MVPLVPALFVTAKTATTASPQVPPPSRRGPAKSARQSTGECPGRTDLRYNWNREAEFGWPSRPQPVGAAMAATDKNSKSEIRNPKGPFRISDFGFRV